MNMATVSIEPLNPVCCGIDIGQIRDNTALCVCEVMQVHTGKFRMGKEFHRPAYVDEHLIFHKAIDADEVMRSEYTVRHITRLPLGMSYPDVSMHVADMLCHKTFQHREVRVLLDCTGVGRPVYDDLKLEIKRRPELQHVQLKPITFSHGEKYNRATGVLAKAFLVSRLQSLLQAARVHGPPTKEMQATVEELRVYEVKISNDGADSYGAFKTGTHDDLATALALACLEDPFSERVTYSERVY